jgi:hypothetical protein
VVTSTGYLPNTDNSTWRPFDGWNSPKRGPHAEIQGWDAMKTAIAGRKLTVCMFEQDGAPCEECHPFFRKLSLETGVSFIFCLTGEGYVIFLNLEGGDRLGGMHIPLGKEGTKLKEHVIRNGYIKLTQDQLPAVLYFHAGSVFLDARPNDFPACPALPRGYG